MSTLLARNLRRSFRTSRKRPENGSLARRPTAEGSRRRIVSDPTIDTPQHPHSPYSLRGNTFYSLSRPPYLYYAPSHSVMTIFENRSYLVQNRSVVGSIVLNHTQSATKYVSSKNIAYNHILGAKISSRIQTSHLCMRRANSQPAPRSPDRDLYRKPFERCGSRRFVTEGSRAFVPVRTLERDLPRPRALSSGRELAPRAVKRLVVERHHDATCCRCVALL